MSVSNNGFQIPVNNCISLIDMHAASYTESEHPTYQVPAYLPSSYYQSNQLAPVSYQYDMTYQPNSPFYHGVDDTSYQAPV